MSDFEVLQTYASWAGTAVPDKLPGIPFANLDVFEDESNLRYRLFYLVPDTSSGKLRCFFYLRTTCLLRSPMGICFSWSLISTFFRRNFAFT